MPHTPTRADTSDTPDASDTSSTTGTLTVRQMAADLQIPERTVRDLARAGTIPAFRAGKHWRCNVDDFEAWKHDRARRRARLLDVL